ncbi:MAG: hypothetical protein KME40_09240 [Komarekiella atlantica HA4396-MV6]|nr:hypothetical protein [Komarekiella atlantica HA4396-MV6]
MLRYSAIAFLRFERSDKFALVQAKIQQSHAQTPKHKKTLCLCLEKFPAEGNPPSPDRDATRTELFAASLREIHHKISIQDD